MQGIGVYMKNSGILAVLLFAIMSMELKANTKVDSLAYGYAYKAKASSVLREGNISYPASNIVAPSISKAWCEGVGGDGGGEWIELVPASTEVSHNFQLSIMPGYVKNERVFHANGRPKSIEILVNGTEKFNFGLQDAGWEQVINIPLSKPLVVKKVKVTILNVYPGDKYDDTCISEILLLPEDNWWVNYRDSDIQKETVTIAPLLNAAMSGDMDSVEALLRLAGGAYYRTAEGGEWLDEIYLDLFANDPYCFLFVLFKINQNLREIIFKAFAEPTTDKYSNDELLRKLEVAIGKGIEKKSVEYLHGLLSERNKN
jgi:hypothetical protein